ncbi:MAG TPA: GNAT family N-acetyltransferase [Acidimicrobiales bacterium]
MSPETAEVTSGHRAAITAVAAGDGGVFSSPAFLDALNRAFFDGAAHEADVAVGEHVVHTLVAGGKPVLDVTFLDFFVPVHPARKPQLRGRYTPRVATGCFPARQRGQIDPLVVEPAPLVMLREFPTWDDVQAHWKRTEKGAVRESRRRAKRIEREVGPLRYSLRDPSPDAFDLCIEWKSQQFRSAGVASPLDDPRERRLLRNLVDNGLAVVSSLRAGDRVIASHIGLDWQGVMHWWLPTFDRELRAMSPGRLLLEWVLQQCYERGDVVFDFLRGDAEYKWIYATHYREVREAGTRPLRRQLELARGRTVRRMPRAAQVARRLRDAALAQRTQLDAVQRRVWPHELPAVVRDAPVLIVSPHLDDAVLSAFGFLERGDATVLTVFAGFPASGTASHWDRRLGEDEGSVAMRKRLAEDDVALQELGVPTVRLPLREDGYRDGAMPREDVERLESEVRRWLAGTGGRGVVLAPSGAGAEDTFFYRLRWQATFPPLRVPGGGMPHPDHVAARDVVVPVVLEAGHPLVLYEELPYRWTGRGDKRVAQLALGERRRPQRFHLHVDPARKAHSVNRYASQVPGLFRPWVRDLAAVMPPVERYWLVTP